MKAEYFLELLCKNNYFLSKIYFQTQFHPKLKTMIINYVQQKYDLLNNKKQVTAIVCMMNNENSKTFKLPILMNNIDNDNKHFTFYITITINLKISLAQQLIMHLNSFLFKDLKVTFNYNIKGNILTKNKIEKYEFSIRNNKLIMHSIKILV